MYQRKIQMDKSSAKQMEHNSKDAASRVGKEIKKEAQETKLKRTIKDLEKTVEDLKSLLVEKDEEIRSLLVEKDEEIRSISRASSASYVFVEGGRSASALRRFECISKRKTEEWLEKLETSSDAQTDNVLLANGKLVATNMQEPDRKIYKVKYTNEMLFLEECLIRLKGMFNDNTQENGEIIPDPETDIMETVSTVHSYLVDVVGKIRRLKFENQYVKMILSGLHKSLIDGEEKPQMDLKPPKDMQNDLPTLELKKNAEAITLLFYEFKTLRADIKTKTEQLKDMTVKQEQLSKQNSKLNKEVNSLRTRLSELAEEQLFHEKPSTYGLGDPYRPTNVAEMYIEIYNTHWTDAFEYLLKTNPEESDETLICSLYAILKDGYCFCKKIRDNQKLKLAEIMFLPAECKEKNEITQTEEVSEILAKHLSEAAKLSSNMAVSNIIKAFVAKKEMKTMYRQIMEPCRTYIEECVKLCWYMQVQTPPLYIDLETAKGHSFLKDMYRGFITTGQRIAYVVWPALFLHYKGPMLVKGVAQGE